MSTISAHDLIRSVVDKNENWRGRAIQMHPVSGGITNENYVISVDGLPQRMFVKIPGLGTERFIDRAVANSAGAAAAELDISPRVHFFDPETGVEFTGFFEGYRAATTRDFQSLDFCREVMGLYRRWHSTPRLEQTKTMFDMVDEHLEQVHADGIRLPEWTAEILGEYERIRARFEESGLDIVPAHNDPMPGNFLVAEGSPMKLIDFDYASNNERSFELGLILTEMFISDEDARTLVADYAGGPDERLYARAQISRAVADTKWGLWGMINSHSRDEDFDYFKYGLWKLQRVFAITRHPEYNTWFNAI